MGFIYTDAVFQIKATEFEVEKEDSTTVVPYTGTDHAVLNALAQRASNESGVCWSGFGMIAKDAHVSRSSVIRAIGTLVELGFISIQPPSEGRASNTYTLHMDKLVAASLRPAKKKLKKPLTKTIKGVKVFPKRKETAPVIRPSFNTVSESEPHDFDWDCCCPVCESHPA